MSGSFTLTIQFILCGHVVRFCCTLQRLATSDLGYEYKLILLAWLDYKWLKLKDSVYDSCANTRFKLQTSMHC